MLSGSSIQACRATRSHILAFEEDNDLFAAVLAPQMRKTVATREETTPISPEASEMEEDEVEPERIVMTDRFSK